MGSCSSVHRNEESKMKFKLSFGSKTNNLSIPPSPIKEKPKNDDFRIDDNVSLKSQLTPSRSTTTVTDYGSKEEAFFDSKPWLDSDCEDDFYSVNGEFTPSRGNTPVHTFGTPIVNKTPFENRTPGSMPEPSPSTEKTKKLFQLFQESIRDNQGDDNENSTSNGKKDVKQTIYDVLPSKSAEGTPYISGANSACSSERSMSEDRVSNRGKSIKSVQCCFPGLISCRSFSDRFRKTSSPTIAANGKP